jgi:hypothetical protein
VSRAHYVTTKRLGEIRAALSERDWSILSDVGRLSVMSGEQIRCLHFFGLTRRLARLELAELVQMSVLERLGRRVGGQHAGSDGYCFSLGLAGQRLLQPLRRRYWRLPTPGPSFLAHAIAVSQLYTELRLLERSGGFRIVGFEAEPACWRRYFGPGGSPRWLKPDADLVIEGPEFEDRYFIELDRATEFPARIAGKAKAYVNYYQSGHEQAESVVFPLVVFVVPSDARRAQLVDVFSNLAAEHWQFFTVLTTKQAADTLAAGSLFKTERREDAS